MINAYFDPKQQRAQIALALVGRTISEASDGKLKSFLASNNLPEAASKPIQLKEKPVKVGEAGAGEFIVGLLPYLIVIWAFYGGFALATDLVAGERKRQRWRLS